MKTPMGRNPLENGYFLLSKENRKTIGEDIKTVEYCFPIGMPICRKLGSKLYEVRSNISDKRIARVIFTVMSDYMVLLNGFIKKDQKTPKGEIASAEKRKKDIK